MKIKNVGIVKKDLRNLLKKKMKITCISDLHGHLPQLTGGDLLIVAGDLTAHDKFAEHQQFSWWLFNQKYRQIILISGNHDNCLEIDPTLYNNVPKVKYLFDSFLEFEGLKIYGSPWTKTFEGMNPKCKAFTYETQEEIAKKWEKIPSDIDILITHSPPQGILDETIFHYKCGCPDLAEKVKELKKLKLHVFGHIHEASGIHHGSHISINASLLDDQYFPVNAPKDLEL